MVYGDQPDILDKLELVTASVPIDAGADRVQGDLTKLPCHIISWPEEVICIISPRGELLLIGIHWYWAVTTARAGYELLQAAARH